MALEWLDHRRDPDAWARAQGVSRTAVDLLLAGPFIDLHNDLEVPVRLMGWNPAKRHGPWRRVVPLLGHTDYPRLREARFTGVVYDLATNVFRRERARHDVTLTNLQRCVAQIEAHPEDLGVACSRSDYDRLTAAGRTAMFLALQGGNALAHDPSVLEGEVGRLLHRITLVHLSSSVLGGSNSPSQADRGITERGRGMVAACDRARVLVDLSHAGEATFWGAMEAHDPTIPVIASHAGLRSVRDHWRNLSDAQCRAIAERGGVVGVVYQGNFLDRVPPGFPCARSRILDHLERLIDVAGEASAAIGTDYDGMITPPHDLPDVTDHPKLVQDMLDRGWSEARVRRVLGENYLGVVREVRP